MGILYMVAERFGSVIITTKMEQAREASLRLLPSKGY
jgi:hypothetical protein